MQLRVYKTEKQNILPTSETKDKKNTRQTALYNTTYLKKTIKTDRRSEHLPDSFSQ